MQFNVFVSLVIERNRGRYLIHDTQLFSRHSLVNSLLIQIAQLSLHNLMVQSIVHGRTDIPYHGVKSQWYLYSLDVLYLNAMISSLHFA